MQTLLYLAALTTMAVMLFRGAAAPRRRLPEADEDLELVLHLANHEATARKQAVAPVHLLYALLQDERLRALAPRVGADVNAIEQRVFACLEALPLRASAEPTYTPQTLAVLARTFARVERPARCTDLLSRLLQDDETTSQVCLAAGADAFALLFLLVHGIPLSELSGPTFGDVAVVFENDDYTTMEFVVELLSQELGVEPTQAAAVMLKVHREGRAPVARFSAAEGRRRADAALARARAAGFPLMIRLDAV